VQIDGPIPAGLAQECDDPLALAERVDADEVAALGEEAQRMQQPVDLVAAGVEIQRAESGRATSSSERRSALTPISSSTTAAPTINPAPRR
jgi:hypothetical protein